MVTLLPGRHPNCESVFDLHVWTITRHRISTYAMSSHEFSRSDYITALALQEQARLQRTQPSSSRHRHNSPSHHTAPVTLPIPDLRFEQTYLKRVGPYVHLKRKEKGTGKDKDDEFEDGAETQEVVTIEWGRIIWITTRDQVISPLIQGALWSVPSPFIS